ncbi:MAG: cellulase family glycosylhydrolase [Flavobacteriales bacterium]|nr:cellulase family glycosylhydrolase [Flavobacteriales bacterium]
MRKSIIYPLIILFGLGPLWLEAQTVADQRCASLGKGMNVSNWLERGWDGNWPTSNGYTKQDLELMQEAGIGSIRLPIYFHAVVDTIAPYTVDTEHLLFDMVDSVIQWTDELNMKLLIDNHHGWDLTNETWRQDLPRFSHMWAVVAERYQNLDPERVMFELMNEPSLLFDKDSLVIMYIDAIDSIRQHTTQHSIVVSPHWGGTAMVLPDFEPLADTNLIYTWHVYDPLDFSHQGLTWHNPFFPSGNPFPNSDTTFFEGWLYDGWQNLIEWKQTYNKPIFLGEFGLSSYCDSASACNWLDYNATRLIQNDIPWFYWDWQWDFSMFNSHVISEDSIYPCFKYYLGLYGDDSFTSVDEIVKGDSPQLHIYPNPSSNGQFTVELNSTSATMGQFQVYDQLGQLVVSGKLNSDKTVIDQQLSSGLYLVSVETNGDRIVRKLIVR